MATLKHKNPTPGVMKFTILVNPSLVIMTVCILSDLMTGVEKEDF